MLGTLARFTRQVRRPPLAAVAISALVLPSLAVPSFARGPEGVADIAPRWSRPRIGVGDGATDLALLRRGAVDDFVAFTEHARRKAVLVPGVPDAKDVAALCRILEELL